MNKSNRVHARIQDFCQGGDGRGRSRRDGINLFYSLQSGSIGFITEGRRGSNFFHGMGVSKEIDITCDFPGGGGGVRTA